MVPRRVWQSMVLVASLAVTGCTGSPPHRDPTPTVTASVPSTAPCTTSVQTGALPTWAQEGFDPPTQPMPHVLGANGDIVAILFGQPLQSPAQGDRANKILWVSRVDHGGDPLKIEATLNGSSIAATREVADGPGPSIIDLPAAGCWSFALSWSDHLDRMSIPYYAS
jgi:hypothetical protein